MAILANRTKTTNNYLEFIKLVLIILRRSLILFFIIISLYLFIAAPKKISTASLEIAGYFISTGLLVYDSVFQQINLITQKFIYLQNLARENIELKLEIAKLQRIQNDINSLQAENIALKKLLIVVEEEQYSYVTAKLLSVSLTPFSKTSLITAGTNHGVEIDQIVINNEGLIGRVIQVSNNYSKIMLIEDVNSRIPVTTLSSREKGILVGNGKNSQIIYLQKNHLIQKDEKVITSGYGNVYPSGILVGYVSDIMAENVIVKPIADLSKTEFVSVLLPHKDIE